MSTDIKNKALTDQEIEDLIASGPPQPLREINLTENSEVVMTKRYVRRKPDGSPDESIHETFWRVASNVARTEQKEGQDASEWANTFYNMLADLRFLPNSPTFTGAGTQLGNLSACFVLPIEDDMGKTSAGIFQTLRDATLIQQTGGGNGFSFSRLRANGALVKSSNGRASGPIGFLKAYDQAFGIVNQGGVRRGANMGVLRVDHPDIRSFITCKTDETAVTNFNISVAITDKFMKAVEDNTTFDLVEPSTNEVVETVQARELFELIVTHAHHNGEPGALFIDRANRDNPIPNVGTYEATNPCGEQWLLPYESCNLGSINLALHVDEENRRVDWEKLLDTVEIATRFLDDVVTENNYVPAVPQLREAALKSRRIGLGIMGLADMMVKLNLRYGAEEGLDFVGQLLEFVRFHAMRVSIQLAKDRGAFPGITGSLYDPQNFKWTPPQPVTPFTYDWERPALDWQEIIDGIKKYGIRNAAQMTIAPTGTIATVAGCEGYGCEPIFALAYTRYVVDENKRIELQYASPLLEDALNRAGLEDEQIKTIIELVSKEGTCQDVDLIPEEIRNALVVSSDITPEEHVKMSAYMQAFIDNSISKTINMPSTATIDDVKQAYELSWKLGSKGLTVYVTGSRETVVLETAATKEAKQQPKTDERPMIYNEKKKPRPQTLTGYTYRMPTPAGTAYITINENGLGHGEPFEVFIHTSKAGSEIAAISEAIGRLLSLILRQASSVSPRERVKEIVRQLEHIGGGRQMGFGPNRVTSLPDAIAQILGTYLSETEQTMISSEFVQMIKEENALPEPKHNGNGSIPMQMKIGDICPQCGAATLMRREGCVSCHGCGYSEC